MLEVKIMSIRKKITAFILSTVIGVSMFGCGDTRTVINVEGVDVPAGVYIYYQLNSYTEAMNKAYEEGNTELMDATIEGKSSKDWINDNALELCKEHVAIQNKFEELGLTLSEENNKLIDKSLDDIMEGYEEKYKKSGIAESSIKSVLTVSEMKNEIFNYYYAKDGIEEVSEDDIHKYYVDNYARIKLIQVSLMDIDGEDLDDEDKEEMIDRANDYVDRINSGEDFDKIADEHKEFVESLKEEAEDSEDDEDEDEDEPEETEAQEEETEETTPAESTEEDETAESTEASETEETTPEETEAPEDEDETEESTEQYKNEYIIVKAASEDDKNATPSIKVNNAIFNDAIVGGKAIVVEDKSICFVMQRLDIAEREDTYEEGKDILLTAMKEDEFNDLAKSWYKDYEFKVNEAAIKKYDPMTLI